MKYEIWLVPNCRADDFRRGITGEGYPDACHCWGFDMSLDAVSKRYRELAEENFQRPNGPWDVAFVEGEHYEDGMSDEEEERRRKIGENAANAALEKYLEELTADTDPLNWPRIEWKDDLKWVTIREAVA